MIKTLWKTRLRSCANCHAMCIIRLTREGPSVRSRAPHTNILSYEEVSDDFETVEMKGRSLVPTPACKRYQKVESNVSYVPLGWPIGCGLGIALFQRATVFLFPRRAKRCEWDGLLVWSGTTADALAYFGLCWPFICPVFWGGSKLRADDPDYPWPSLTMTLGSGHQQGRVPHATSVGAEAFRPSPEGVGLPEYQVA